MNEQLTNRLKSFGWRLSAYIVAVVLAWLADNIGLLELNATVTAVVGLVLGELSKWWANKMNVAGKTYFGRAK